MVIDKVYESGEMSTMELRNLVFTFHYDHFIILFWPNKRGTVGLAFMATFTETTETNHMFGFSQKGILLMKLLTGDQGHGSAKW